MPAWKCREVQDVYSHTPPTRAENKCKLTRHTTVRTIHIRIIMNKHHYI